MPFDIGFLELCLVTIVGLVVLGPERLPVAARAIGRWIGKARRAFSSFKQEIDRELQIDELRQQIKQQQQQMDAFMNRPMDEKDA
ncbi:Sec-independent protein translocase protein TatB [Pleionea litopenaei]|uniref:Sec-independent protein translocase protein TatB n=1 Tax=Pleionea litopenaei TaxID=3070815 RepID=A0AA51X5V2_9GAMM|nr:Sec-independent protein translocase protein TatB [Pleionea sp. HL-JVS1]WMS86438.1 Sec-independent protein translocase protein TatB [Pleionea sp. HL-JVS1]